MGGGITVAPAKCNYILTQPKHSWMRCVLLHTPHPNYSGFFADECSCPGLRPGCSTQTRTAFARDRKSLKLLSPPNDQRFKWLLPIASKPCSLSRGFGPYELAVLAWRCDYCWAWRRQNIDRSFGYIFFSESHHGRTQGFALACKSFLNAGNKSPNTRRQPVEAMSSL